MTKREIQRAKAQYRRSRRLRQEHHPMGVKTLRSCNARLTNALAEYALPVWPFAGPTSGTWTHQTERWRSGEHRVIALGARVA